MCVAARIFDAGGRVIVSLKWLPSKMNRNVGNTASLADSTLEDSNALDHPLAVSRVAGKTTSERPRYFLVKMDLGIMQWTPFRISTTWETRQSPMMEVSE